MRYTAAVSTPYRFAIALSALAALLAAVGWLVLDVVVLGLLLGVLALAIVALLIWGSISGEQTRLVAGVQELLAHGTRVQARVLDVAAYASEHSGATFQAAGQQLVLHVEYTDAQGATQRATVYLVATSDEARALVGTDVTLLVHPTDPALRTLEGYLPNGRRVG